MTIFEDNRHVVLPQLKKKKTQLATNKSGQHSFVSLPDYYLIGKALTRKCTREKKKNAQIASTVECPLSSSSSQRLFQMPVHVFCQHKCKHKHTFEAPFEPILHLITQDLWIILFAFLNTHKGKKKKKVHWTLSLAPALGKDISTKTIAEAPIFQEIFISTVFSGSTHTIQCDALSYVHAQPSQDWYIFTPPKKVTAYTARVISPPRTFSW